VKKLLLLLATLGGVGAAYRRTSADRADAELWAEATTPPDLR